MFVVLIARNVWTRIYFNSDKTGFNWNLFKELNDTINYI